MTHNQENCCKTALPQPPILSSPSNQDMIRDGIKLRHLFGAYVSPFCKKDDVECTQEC